MKPFDIPHDTLPTPEDASWRDVAHYNRIVSKLYFYLKPLNWQPIEAAHSTGWQKQGVIDIRTRYKDCGKSYPWVALDRVYDSRYERFKDCLRSTTFPALQRDGSLASVRVNYVGRLIRRYVLQSNHRDRHFATLVLPIPAPAAYAQRRMQAAWERYTKAWAYLDEQTQATAPNKREYLAIRLRGISQLLTNVSEVYSGGPHTIWEASAKLKEVLQIRNAWLPSPSSQPIDFDAKPWQGPPAPDKVGEMRATVDYFWQCLYDFHEAERLSMPVLLAISALTPEEAGTKPKPAAMPVAFDHYIKEEYREKLIPFLKAAYTGQKPQIVACMLIALQDLGALTNPLQRNVTELHAALEAFLGNAGTRQNLTESLTKLDKASEKQNVKIQAQRGRIKTYMEQS